MPFHDSMSFRTSSRRQVSWAISCSTVLKSVPISFFSASSSPGAPGAASRVTSATCRARRPSSVRSGTYDWLQGIYRTLERDAIRAREHTIHVEHHDDLLTDLRDAAHELVAESFEERRWWRHTRRRNDGDFLNRVND